MSFNELLTKQDPRSFLSVIDILSSSGLNKRYSDLAVLSQRVKRAVFPDGVIEKASIEALVDNYNSLKPEYRKLIDSSAKLVMEGEKTYKADQGKLDCKTDHISFSFRGMDNFDRALMNELKNDAKKASVMLKEKSGPGSDFLGWLDLPNNDITEIQKTADEIRANSDAVVFIGIGGSYLGAKSVISALLPENYNLMAKELNNPEVYFAGQNLSTSYLTDLLSVLKNKRVTLLPISKSGTTTEPAVAFRILKNELSKAGNTLKYAAITDKAKGALKELADNNGWKTFVIPDDVGGRYSVLTPVGLLPIAIAGIDISKIMNGAKSISKHLNKNDSCESNPALAYSIYRQGFNLLGKDLEVVSSWSPYLTQITEWWKQLFGESEGKDGKGIFVASTTFTTDLHSVGQLIQDGKRNFFETFLTVEEDKSELQVSEDKMDLDKLNYLSGKSPDFINQKAYEGTRAAHEFGHVPTLTIKLNHLGAQEIGALLYWWEYSCGISAYMQNCNPFNQPGVEEYKKRMFELLGKP